MAELIAALQHPQALITLAVLLLVGVVVKLHLLLVLLEGLQHLGRQWHHTLSACLGGRPTVLT